MMYHAPMDLEPHTTLQIAEFKRKLAHPTTGKFSKRPSWAIVDPVTYETSSQPGAMPRRSIKLPAYQQMGQNIGQLIGMSGRGGASGAGPLEEATTFIPKKRKKVKKVESRDGYRYE